MRRGFSLLEVVVAASLFLVGVAGILTSYSTITNLAETQRLQVDALSVAEDVLDELRLQGRGGDDIAVGDHDRFFDRDRQVVAAGGLFHVHWTVRQDPDFSFRRVDLDVSWTGSNGVVHRVPFVTFRAG